MTISKLSSCQEQILVQLVSKAKTIEELRAKTNYSYREVMTEVKDLLLKGAIEKKKGFPTTYRIAKSFQMVAKKLRAKFDMSDLLDDPCDIFSKHYQQKHNRD